MRRAALVVVPIALLAAAVAVAYEMQREPPEPFPCVRTSQAGWLTAASDRALVRIEWGDDPRISAGPPERPVMWSALSDAEARARVHTVLEPLRTRVPSDTEAKVSLFVWCDGHGEYWHEDAVAPPGRFRDCLKPPRESRWGCFKRVAREHSDDRESPAGAVADRMRVEAKVPPPEGARSDLFPDE